MISGLLTVLFDLLVEFFSRFFWKASVLMPGGGVKFPFFLWNRRNPRWKSLVFPGVYGILSDEFGRLYRSSTDSEK